MIKPLVMIIEDDRSFSEVISKNIVSFGYDVLQTFSAKEAKKVLIEEKVQPALIICNTNLPDTSGTDFFRETLIRNLNLNICMLTSKVERLELLESLQLGAVDFINRPIQPSFYSEKLGRLVEIGQKKAAVKNVLAQKNDYTKAEQVISALRVHNSIKKPA
jgi:two-component system, OmpR family, phosphate regulon response regulator PhoB